MLAGQALATKSDNALAQNLTSLPRAVLEPRRAAAMAHPSCSKRSIQRDTILAAA
jgi:hypothetical protein